MFVLLFVKRLMAGERTTECALENQFWRPQKVGLVWSVPVSSNENNSSRTTGGGGGELYHRWGSKIGFGEGFVVCFPLP